LPITPTTTNLSTNHTITTPTTAEKFEMVEVDDDEDAPPQDLLDALVLGDVGQKMKTDSGFSKSQQHHHQKQQRQTSCQNQVIFAKNVTFKKTGDPV